MSEVSLTLEITDWGAEGMAEEREGCQSEGAEGVTFQPWLQPTPPKRLSPNPFSSPPTSDVSRILLSYCYTSV